MTIGAGFVVLAVLVVVIEGLNVWLGLWSDRLSERLRRRRNRESAPRPWTDRTGTH